MLLSRAVSDEFLDDFKLSVTEEEHTDITFATLVTKMTTRYAPNTNKVRDHFLFHRLSQDPSEKFDDFVHRVHTSAAQCDFKYVLQMYTVSDTLVRDQIITGTIHAGIRNKALKKQWSLDDLIKEGRIIESGALPASELRKEQVRCQPDKTWWEQCNSKR